MSIHVVIAPVGSRTAMAGSSGSDTPRENAIPTQYNRQLRRVLNQAANAAVEAKGTIFAIVYRRLVPRLGHAQAIGAITHRLCRLIWKILHQSIRYEERGPAVSGEAQKVRARKMIRERRSLGYSVELLPAASNSRA